MPIRLPLVLVLSLLLAGCGWFRGSRTEDPSSGALYREQANAELVEEALLTPPYPEEELDSLAIWQAPGGARWVIATAKVSDHLLVFDAGNGELLSRHGGHGKAPGLFNRANGIAVFGDLVFVAERDNHRVQVMSLPDFRPLATFGENELRSPYGLWLHPLDDERIEILVTDSYLADVKTLTVPPLAELGQRIKRYELLIDGDAITARHTGSFGDTSEDGALRMVESIAGDVEHQRLLIAEEDNRVGTTLRVYDFAGRFTGLNLPEKHFKAQAEGVALWACEDGDGYWIATDQSTRNTVFHIFDRRELAYLGSFAGRTVANTDGIALDRVGSTRFPAGALYVVH
ncbi:MAG TPA: phytase, partial [Arenimonas sp.]|nr:phytase [Arenimonas sp.]